MIQLSIIIPVYNVEAYLEECLNSAVNQNIDNYEIIIVNDGSTDGSEDIIDKFTKNYSFIKKVNKENNGLGAARNTGIRLATGKYIGFIDSDDYIDENMLFNMIKRAEENNVDIIICDVEVFDDNDKKQKWYFNVKKKFYNKNMSNEDVLKLYLTDRIKGFAWNKIYKRSLFTDNNVLYEEGVYYEDIYTTLRLLTYAKTINLIDEPYYKYRQHYGSITRGITLKHIDDFTFNGVKCIEFMEETKSFKGLNEYKRAFEISTMNSILELYYKHFNFNIKYIQQNYNTYFSEYNYRISFKTLFLNNVITYKHKKKYILNKLKVYVYIKKFKFKIKNILGWCNFG